MPSEKKMVSYKSKLRVFLAFVISPFVGILIPVLVAMGPILLAVDGGIGFIAEGIILALAFFVPAYVAILILSIPVFFLVRYYIGWVPWSCSAASLIVVIIFGLTAILSAENYENLLSIEILTGTAAGSILYGLAFWVLSSYKNQRKPIKK